MREPASALYSGCRLFDTSKLANCLFSLPVYMHIMASPIPTSLGRISLAKRIEQRSGGSLESLHDAQALLLIV